jgi:hypothetical protein
MHFRCSAWPLAARLERGVVVPVANPASRLPSTGIDDATAGYAAAMSASPWLRRFPMALEGTVVEPPDHYYDKWRVRDRDGCLLPMPDRFAHGWLLLSLSGGRPISLFGEYDGTHFRPLSVLGEDVQLIVGRKGIQ